MGVVKVINSLAHEIQEMTLHGTQLDIGEMVLQLLEHRLRCLWEVETRIGLRAQGFEIVSDQPILSSGHPVQKRQGSPWLLLSIYQIHPGMNLEFLNGRLKVLVLFSLQFLKYPLSPVWMGYHSILQN